MLLLSSTAFAVQFLLSAFESRGRKDHGPGWLQWMYLGAWNLPKCRTDRRGERDRKLKAYVWGGGGCEDVA